MRNTKGPLLGQATFRLSPESHQELLDIARNLGIDLSGLINQMLAEAKPVFLQRATEVIRRQEAARKEFEAIAFSPPVLAGPLLQRAIDAGRPFKGAKRIGTMTEAIAGARKKKDPPLSAFLLAAVRVLEEEETRRQIEEAVRNWEADAVGDDEAGV